MPRLPITPAAITKVIARALSRLTSATSSPLARSSSGRSLPPAPRSSPPSSPPATSSNGAGADEPEAPAVEVAPRAGRVGKYDVALAELVNTRPGITVAQAAAEIQVHPTALYPVIRRLEAAGTIVKAGRGLQPPGAAGMEQLWCEEGHTWARPRVRGRKPKRCPAHR